LPEFALAMYLRDLKLHGKSLPSEIPQDIKNEVLCVIDIINGRNIWVSLSPPTTKGHGPVADTIQEHVLDSSQNQGNSSQPKKPGFLSKLLDHL
jgi:hypothetical protein